ncbi:sensor histidine kinase [Kitasatospora gansuensis]
MSRSATNTVAFPVKEFLTTPPPCRRGGPVPSGRGGGHHSCGRCSSESIERLMPCRTAAGPAPRTLGRRDQYRTARPRREHASAAADEPRPARAVPGAAGGAGRPGRGRRRARARRAADRDTARGGLPERRRLRAGAHHPAVGRALARRGALAVDRPDAAAPRVLLSRLPAVLRLPAPDAGALGRPGGGRADRGGGGRAGGHRGRADHREGARSGGGRGGRAAHRVRVRRAVPGEPGAAAADRRPGPGQGRAGRDPARGGRLAERQRLAREIHDTLAQGLSSIVLLARSAESALPADPGAARERIAEVGRTASANLAEARRFVQALTPPALDGVTLTEALRRLADGQGVAFHLDGEPYPLPVEAEVALLRLTQEALANAARHAEAQAVAVTLTYLDDEVTLDVFDDGVGFDPLALPSGAGRRFGLHGMRERIAALGGRLTVESAPGEGTVVAVSLPLRTIETAEAVLTEAGAQ